MFEHSLLQQGSSAAFLLLAVVVLAIAAHRPILRRFGARRRWECLPDLPVVNLKGNDFSGALNEYFNNLQSHLEYGRKQYRDTGFQIWTPEGYVVILPEGLTEELKLAKDTVIDPKALARAISGETEFVQIRNPHFLSALRSNLISKLANLAPAVTQKIQEIVAARLSKPSDWTPVNAWDLVSKTVAETSARTFVGDELGRDPEWQRITLDYTNAIGMAGRDLRYRSLVGQWIAVIFKTSAAYRRVLKFRQDAYRKLKPLLEARAKASRSPDFKKPNDAIQWIIDDVAASNAYMSLEKQAEQQTVFIFASITTTGSSSLTAVYDLLSNPQFMAPLREEIDQVWSEYNGQINHAALQKMTKLDSFVKETQRMNTLATFTNQREVQTPEGLNLSNGMHLPKGTVFSVPTEGINRDPRIYDNPDEFQAFRFADKRAANPDDANRFFFTSTGPTQMNFGHGRHSCPGRFFAALELKMILATLLHNYEFQPLAERPRGPKYGGSTLAKKDVDIWYRARDVASD